MPNLYFTRDPGACVGEGINIHRMHTPRASARPALKYMYLYNRDFATPENKMWYDLSDSYSIEGRRRARPPRGTSWPSACPSARPFPARENFARNLLQNSGFKKVLAFDIPETRAFMHLDTVFTMVDYDKFTIHPEIEGPLSVYEMTLDDHGELQFRALKEELQDILALELKLLRST